MEEFGNNFFEDFFFNLEYLPSSIKRDIDLIRVLDREAFELTKELQTKEYRYLECVSAQTKVPIPGTSTYTIVENLGLSGIDELKLQIESLRPRIKRKLDQKVYIIECISNDWESIMRKLDLDISTFEKDMQRFNHPQNSISLKNFVKDSIVAIQPSLFGQEIILGRVISSSPSLGGLWEVGDVDDEMKTYSLSDSQIFELSLPESSRKLFRGEAVLAVYPDTTCFYPAHIFVVPKRDKDREREREKENKHRDLVRTPSTSIVSLLPDIDGVGNGVGGMKESLLDSGREASTPLTSSIPSTLLLPSLSLPLEAMYQVQFQNDADPITGLTPLRPVPPGHLLRPPPSLRSLLHLSNINLSQVLSLHPLPLPPPLTLSSHPTSSNDASISHSSSPSSSSTVP